jgi:hypothetical protein
MKNGNGRRIGDTPNESRLSRESFPTSEDRKNIGFNDADEACDRCRAWVGIDWERTRTSQGEVATAAPHRRNKDVDCAIVTAHGEESRIEALRLPIEELNAICGWTEQDLARRQGGHLGAKRGRPQMVPVPMDRDAIGVEDHDVFVRVSVHICRESGQGSIRRRDRDSPLGRGEVEVKPAHSPRR